ncbi:hypothetical protein SAMN04489864_102380 [Pedobacter insulae]|uniref:Uncharacterized protein n=1 Tax=Pedobacter insulae TaxID=414048 RepID=A0A1I2V2C1_9SPHI|nr:hypothetical protein SAMN04489864_102380 [Pedobacter insulae]
MPKSLNNSPILIRINFRFIIYLHLPNIKLQRMKSEIHPWPNGHRRLTGNLLFVWRPTTQLVYPDLVSINLS